VLKQVPKLEEKKKIEATTMLFINTDFEEEDISPKIEQDNHKL